MSLQTMTRFEDARVEGDVGRIRWIATYPFSKTGRTDRGASGPVLLLAMWEKRRG